MNRFSKLFLLLCSLSSVNLTDGLPTTNLSVISEVTNSKIEFNMFIPSLHRLRKKRSTDSTIKSVDSYEKEMDTWLSTMAPGDKREGALEAHGKWLKHAGRVETNLNNKLVNCQKYLGLLGFRTKIEDVVHEHYPLKITTKTFDKGIADYKNETLPTNETRYGKPERLSYCDCIHEMLHSENERFTNDPGVMMFRENLKELNITNFTFMKKLRWVYSQMSYEAAHKVYDEVPLPEYYEYEKIKERLSCVGIRNDPQAVVSLQAILKPIPL